MTNLQSLDSAIQAPPFLTRDRVLWGVPALIGGLLALGTGVFLAIPSWNRLQQEQAELTKLTALSNTIPALRRRIMRAEQRHQEAQRMQSWLLSMIAGSGDISTFMAQIGDEADRSDVLLDSYEPVKSDAPAVQGPSLPANSLTLPGRPKKAPPGPTDPLLADGLQKTVLLITAHGSATNLLTFLRRLENLSLLVVQSDLSLTQVAPATAASPNPGESSSSATLKLNLSLYAKKAP